MHNGILDDLVSGMVISTMEHERQKSRNELLKLIRALQEK